jgi:hypothetical protein
MRLRTRIIHAAVLIIMASGFWALVFIPAQWARQSDNVAVVMGLLCLTLGSLAWAILFTALAVARIRGAT